MHYLITGGARGIGRVLARSLLTSGHRVFVIDSNAAELAHTSSLLRSIAPAASAATHEADISSLPALRAAIAEADKFFGGRLDVLVNNAMALPHTFPVDAGEGEAAMASTAEEQRVVEHWDRQIAVGLSGPFHASRLCVPMLREAEPVGCVVNISSTRARMAEVDHEGYSAAKAGLLGLGQAMSVSLGTRYGIRVNGIVVGWVNVEGEGEEGDRKGWKWEEGLGEEDHKWHPAGRVGKGEDVLGAVEYLVRSGWVTGTEMVLDGGVTRRMVYPE
ncbi:NAD(P)-binding protein [Myriangium duriaei CBS 260.36]|uniref:NAD(P)-binding protein n=1 Tax=Myriangium duriaei CBS 260.36 TaxID=1168546 RepID=A0A9P4IYD1_9PEZI|nr:NAD(P)-binding protein [Myriangium duriaei CBS 260.36]